MKPSRLIFTAALGALIWAVPPSPSHAEEGPDLTPVRLWIEKQSKVSTVSGTFNQERKLRTVKRPLTSSGRFSFKIPGSFRWEVGSPPELVAVRKAGGDFWIVRPEKKVAERHTAESLERDGKANAAAFLEAGFPRDFASFDRDFEVEEIRPNANDAIMEIEVSLRDRRAATAVRKIVFYVDSSEHLLRGFKLFFRDTSTIFSQFTEVRPGVSLPDSTFEVSTAGYKVVEGK